MHIYRTHTCHKLVTLICFMKDDGDDNDGDEDV